ncbi:MULTISPECIES: energy transducer TonB [unclassified Microcoleus]|uniref:energy transducer TonB n=1 Tax=unclassified Microcoleus TaxID=2642155 RepID=UPI002FD38AF3
MIATGPGIGPSQPFDPNNRPAPGQPDSNLRGNPETMAKKIRDEYLALFNDFFRSYPDLLPVGQTFSVNNVAYPVAACSDKLEGRALFGAVVQPQGSLRAKPKMIVATGYPILDKAAIAGIESLTFPPASTHKLYQLAVDFKYDEKVCSGIPVTPTRPNPPGQQQPAPAPTAPSRPTGQPPSPAPTEVKPPAPSNKPQPGAQPSPSAPKPAAKPSPSPEQKPAAEQSPSPQPQPAEKSPQPEAAPSPAAEESPQPEAAPSPAAEESPQPEAAPSPAPEVSPSPEAAPSPAAEVSPSPTPEVSPSPAAEVSPSPSPEAAPSPAATEN